LPFFIRRIENVSALPHLVSFDARRSEFKSFLVLHLPSGSDKEESLLSDNNDFLFSCVTLIDPEMLGALADIAEPVRDDFFL
jgi:hypothetical protein